jgi:hypothetical protein
VQRNLKNLRSLHDLPMVALYLQPQLELREWAETGRRGLHHSANVWVKIFSNTTLACAGLEDFSIFSNEGSVKRKIGEKKRNH